MRLDLIFPKGQEKNFWDLKSFTVFTGKKGSGIPLALPTLAALTPSDIEVRIIDENIEPIDFNDKPDLAAISFFTAFATRAYQIAEAYRMKGTPVILGGIHPSMLPSEAIQHANAVVIGEGENIWEKAISDFRENKLQKFYVSPGPPSLDKLTIPRWDLVDIDSYNFFSVQATRGCPFNCDFCSVTAFLGRKCRFKPIENVIAEIKFLQSLDENKSIVFADDNIAANPEYARQLFEAITPLKLKWWGQASTTIANDDELLRLMKESGCSQIFIGFESLSQETLDHMNKGKINRAEEYEAIVERIHSHGISVFASLILGNDYDNRDIFQRTLEFITRTNIASALIGLLVPFPGTELHKRLKSEGRLLHEDWEKYTGDTVCFTPKSMSPEILQNEHRLLMRRLYSYDALYKRLSNLWNQGILVKDDVNYVRKFFSISKAFVAAKSFSFHDPAKTYFVWRSLLHPKNPRFSSILSAVDFHDLIYSYPIEGVIQNDLKKITSGSEV